MTINSLIGESGVITQANKSTIETEVAEVKEKFKMSLSEHKVEKAEEGNASQELFLVNQGFI